MPAGVPDRAEHSQTTAGDTATEAARLRYELARLRDRRPVRTALALTEVRRAGARAAVQALRGRAPRLDVPGPAHVPPRPVYPHLRVVCTGPGRLLAGTAPHERATPATAELLLARDRPDLVLVDATAGWSPGQLTALRAAAARRAVPVVTLGPGPAAALADADLRVAGEQPVPGAHLELGPRVDIRRWTPAGLAARSAGPREGLAGLDPAAARGGPIVVQPVLAPEQREPALAALAAGALVVTGPDTWWAAALAGSGAEADLLVDDAGEVPAVVAALAADDDRRHRLSVRLRRHVQRHHSTRAALVAVVTALGIDTAPDERISVLLPSRRPDRLAAVTADLAAQRHVELELLLLPHGDAPVPEGLPGITRMQRVSAERPLGAVLNAGLDLATGAYCAKVDDDDRYGTDHLGDQLLALHHSGAELVGRRVHGVYAEDRDVTLRPGPGGEECFEDHLPGGTLLTPTGTLRSVRWRHVPRAVDTELVRAVHVAGGSVYSAHRYGYVRVRHGDHTYDPEVAFSGEEIPGLDPTMLEA